MPWAISVVRLKLICVFCNSPLSILSLNPRPDRCLSIDATDLLQVNRDGEFCLFRIRVFIASCCILKVCRALRVSAFTEPDAAIVEDVLMKATRRAGLVMLTILALMMLTWGPAVAEKPNTLVREEIPEQYKWDLSHIYSSWEEWEADVAKLQALMDEIVAFQGRLSEGPDILLQYQQLNDKLGMLAIKAYRYAGLQQVTNMNDSELQAKEQQVRILFAQFGQKTAWAAPEMLQIPEDTLMAWVDRTPDLEPYRFEFSELYREQEHVLDESGEQLLSYSSTFRGMPRDTYSMLSTADVKFPDVVLSNGDTVKATHATYGNQLRTNRNQDDRYRLFEAHFSTFNDFENTYAAIYNGILQRDWAMAQSRNYESCAQAAMDGNNIPIS
ncbi:hypothetical protein GF324_12710, partial [bacterium]|nr:hypothetical protein [bacterium]